MLKVSDAFNSAFAAPDRELRARVTIGKTVYDSDDLTSINYDSGAMTGEQFSIGSTYMNSAKITFSHLVEGLKQLDEVLVEFGVLKPDGAVEYVKMGTFIVDDKIQMDRNNNTTAIECMDRMTMLGGAYVSKLTYPARIKDVAVEIANMAGVKANETSFARLSENKINQPTGYTYRDAIGLIAQFQMGFALFDRDGLLDIRTLQDNSFKIDPNQYFLKGLVKNETFFKLNGISCTVVNTSKDENGNETSKTTVLQSGSSSGAQIKLANNVMTQDVLDRMYEALKFTNYYPFSLNWNGNPAVEAGDWLTVEDLQGNEFKVPNMSYTLTYNGGLTATSKADTSVSSPATYSYGGTISNIVNEIGGRESAEGNHIYEGTEDQEPTLSKEGDLWYKHVGPDTEEWIYKDGKWEFLTSTKTANDAADAAGKASKEAEEANKQANKAVDGANDAVAKAGFATDTATQAKSDAATAGEQAKDALTSAGTAVADAATAKNDAATALTGAKKALTDSSSAMADSAQAIKDSATAKIQAANAATQANQAVTDASTAKADAAAAKGQATNALGQANTAIGNAADALNKVNDMQVGGRNLYLNSKVIDDSYAKNRISTKITVEPFDSTTNMWHIVAEQGTGSPNGIYLLGYANNKLPDTTDWSYSIDIKGTGKVQTFGIENSSMNPIVGTIGTEWSRISQTGHVDNEQKTLVMYFDCNSSPLDVYIKLPKLEIGNTPTDWSPAPEDVQQQFTDINGELSQKVSQTTYNVLAGTVDTVSTIAKQNQSTIGTLATKTSVDTVNKTATTAQTLAQQNANELLNKASTNTVDTLTQRVTTAESTLSQTATKAELALTNTDVDKLNDTVASQALDITATADGLKLKADSSTLSDLAGNVTKNSAQLELTATKAELQVAQTNVDNLKKTVTSNTAGMTANANALKLKADSSTVSNLDGRVTSLSGQLDVQSDLISAKVTASDVTGMLGNYATQTWTQSQIKITADGINSTLSSVKTTVDGQTTSINDLKADSSSFKSQFTTVNNTLGKQATDIGSLQASSKELTTGFNTLTSDNTTNKNDISQLKQTATEFNSTLMTVQTQVQNSAVGTNLLTGTAKFTFPLSRVGGTQTIQKYDDATNHIQYTSNTPIPVMGPYWQLLTPTVGQVYTLSADVCGNGNIVGQYFRYEGSKNGSLGKVNLTNDWQRISNTFRINATTGAWVIYANNSTLLKVKHIKIEKGSLATDWCPNPADNATVTALSKLSQTVNGIQTTVSGKADQSQITQLSGRITSVVGDVSANSSQITQMKADINLRVKAGDVINQINISPESILIAGQKVHITGQTSIDNAVIKDAMIADIKADKITAGTLNAANVDVINLNANNITTGTIKGANLSMNLNTGEVLFQKGSIKSTNGNLNIHIDDGSMSLTNSQGEGAYFIDGKIAMTKNDIWANGAIHYGQLTFGNNIFGNTLGSVSGVQLEGAGGVIVGNKEFNPLTLFGPGKTAPSGGGFAANNSFATLVSKGWASIEGGTLYDTAAFSNSNPSIVAGVSGRYSAPGAWTPTSDKGPASFVKGKMVGLYAEDGMFSMDHGTIADLAAAVDGRSGYILSAATYARTYASGAQMTITPNGVFGRISSASKYKLAIGEISTLNDEAHQFLSVKPKQWFDKSESEALADSMTTGNTDYVDDAKALPHNGFIAEDLYTAGLDSYVIRGNDGSIESIQYDRLPVLHHELIRELFNRLDAAEMEIYKLKQEVLNNAN